MQCDYALQPVKTSTHPFEVQVPSLAGISIPPMKKEPSMSSNGGWRDSQRHLRPTLQRIDTEVAAPRLPVIIDQQTSRHAPSRSQDFGTGYFYGAAVSSSLPSQGRSDLLTPFSALERRECDVLPAEHARLRRRGTVSSVPGPYISSVSRSASSAGTSATSASPSVYAPSPLSPSPFAISPGVDIADDTVDGDEEVDPEDAWNLIPYHIPWGSSYHGYKRGTLPGPDGKCLFLRSPTPLKNQRTGQACEKCRERKAKCSGTRPSCARCIARGHVCEYGPEIKRARKGDDDDDDDDADIKEEEEEEESIPPTRVRSRSDARNPKGKSLTGNERRKTIADVRATVTIPPPPMLRRHSAVDAPTSPYNRKKRKAPLRRSTLTDGLETPKSANYPPLSSPLNIFSANPHHQPHNAPSPSSASDTPSESESLPSSASPTLMPHSAGLSQYGEEALQQYRFPECSSPGGVELGHPTNGHGGNHHHHNDMELDLELARQFPVQLTVPDLPTPTSNSQLHAPNPLRYSVSMPQLPHVQISQVAPHDQTRLQPQLYHHHQPHSAGGYMYFPHANDGYSTSTTGSTTDGTDLEFDFMPSPSVVMHSWNNQQSRPTTSSSGVGSSEFGLEPLPPVAGGHHDPGRAYSFDSAQSSAPEYQSYPGACGDASQDASALALLEELNLQRSHIPNPFNPMAEWTTA